MSSRLLRAIAALAVAVLIADCQKPSQRALDISPGAASPRGALRVAKTATSNLTVTFNGAIAFVPEDSTDPTKYARVTALAVRADGVDQNGDFKNQYLAKITNRFKVATPPIPPIPPHYAYLRVKANNYCADASVPCQPSSTAGTDDYIYIPLVSDDIQIASLAPPSPAGIPKAGSFDSSANLADYSSHGQVCSGCLDDKPNPADVVDRVAARLRFSAGTLTPDPDPANSLVCDWHFFYIDSKGVKSESTNTLPKLYQRLMLSAQLPGSEVTVNVVPFQTSPARPLHSSWLPWPAETTSTWSYWTCPRPTLWT
jgi:hypothetical protein